MDVPLIAHESEVARLERIIKRLWIMALVLIILLVATNGAWLWYESQWETVETTVEQDITTDTFSRVVVSGTGDAVSRTGTAESTNQKPNP